MTNVRLASLVWFHRGISSYLGVFPPTPILATLHPLDIQRGLELDILRGDNIQRGENIQRGLDILRGENIQRGLDIQHAEGTAGRFREAQLDVSGDVGENLKAQLDVAGDVGENLKAQLDVSGDVLKAQLDVAGDVSVDRGNPETFLETERGPGRGETFLETERGPRKHGHKVGEVYGDRLI